MFLEKMKKIIEMEQYVKSKSIGDRDVLHEAKRGGFSDQRCGMALEYRLKDTVLCIEKRNASVPGL